MVYELCSPLDGLIEITQGINGPFSHGPFRKSADYTNSIDIKVMPDENIYAPISGKLHRIFEEQDKYSRSLKFKKGMLGNFLEIRLIDGSILHLQHLARYFATDLRLKIDDFLSQGDLIGKTGRSGWIGPMDHLHMMIYRRKGLKLMTLPFSLQGCKSLEHTYEMTAKLLGTNY